MKNVYELTAHNLKHGFRVEHRIFTSYRTAKLSLQHLVDYLNNNHKLNSSEIEYVSCQDKHYKVILSQQYSIVLNTIEVIKKPCIYI